MNKPLKSSRALWIFMLLTLLVFSCNQSIDKGSVQTINEKDTSKIAPPVQSGEETNSFDSLAITNIIDPDAETFILDTDKSIINWYCVIHSGYTKFKKGNVQFVDGNIVGGGFEIRMDSINNVDIDYELMKEVLVNTLKSPDFFDVKKFPYAHLELVRVKEIPGGNFEVVGNLTIKNVTNQIRFHCNIQYQDGLIKFGSERFSIDRTKWGITIYSENFEQTDDSFLFTDLVEIQVRLEFNGMGGTVKE